MGSKSGKGKEITYSKEPGNRIVTKDDAGKTVRDNGAYVPENLGTVKGKPGTGKVDKKA